MSQHQPFRITALLVACAMASFAGAVQATPIDDAHAHFDAIANGDVEAVMAGYAEQAVFQWVGGPLDGAYTTPQAIESVWQKFTNGQGTLTVTAADVQTAHNPKGATVTANVVFEGKAAIKVRYVLTYRNDKIVNEVWQIDPQLAVAAE